METQSTTVQQITEEIMLGIVNILSGPADLLDTRRYNAIYGHVEKIVDKNIVTSCDTND